MWKTDTLKNVCSMIKRGIAPKYIESGGVCVINQKCVRDHIVNTEQSRRHNLGLKKVPDERFIRLGDVLVNSTGTGTLGRVAQIREEPEEPTTVDTHVTIVRPMEGKFFDPFFGYMMVKIEDEIANSGEGASGQTELARTTLENKFKVSYPTSLEEQKRIVAILDEVFAGVDQAIANTEQNIQSACELFESYLNTIFTQKGEGWDTDKLINLTSKIGSGATPKGGAASYKDEGISLIRSLNVHDRRFKKDKLAFIDDAQADKLSNVVVESGDVLFNITGASVARCCITPDEYLPARVNQHVSILRPKSEKLLSKFLCYLMTSRPYKERLLGIGEEGGSTRQAITKAQLQQLDVSFPVSLDKQNEVVEFLNDSEVKAKELEAIYQQKLTALKELKQSLLQKAFAGELSSNISEAA